MKKFLLAAALTGFFFAAFAFRLESGDTTTINEPVNDDLYIAGGTVTINAPVRGDLIVAGGNITINDSVTGDILIAGGEILLNGHTGDDIRCAGGNIRIKKNVEGDLVIAGGRIEVDRDVTVGGMLAAGGEVTLDGNIKGSARIAGGEVQMNGSVDGDIDCRGGQLDFNGTVGGRAILSSSDLTVGSNAVFNGGVRYWNGEGRVDFGQAVKSGQAVWDPKLQLDGRQWYFLGAATLLGLLWYLGMALLMIFIVQYLFSSTMKRAADVVFAHALRSFGFGLLFFFAVPVAAAIAFITIIGVPVGALLLIMYITLILLATVITSVVVANWYNNRHKKAWSYTRLSMTAFLVFIILKVVSLMPFIGFVVMLLMVCIAFGGILASVHWRRRRPDAVAVI